MILKSKKEQAFDTLSIPAKLHIELEEAKTDQEKFIQCIRYATDIAQRKSLTNLDEATNTNLKIIMQLITSYLDSGVHPDSTDGHVPAISHAITYPTLVKLLLDRGADPNFRDNFQNTPLHHAAKFFHTFYKENLFTTAELLASAGTHLHANNSQGKKPIELIKNTLLLSKEEITEIEARFKKITENPRNISEITTESIEKSPYLYLQLTEIDHVKIALYKEKKYELINSIPTYQALNALNSLLTSYMLPQRESRSTQLLRLQSPLFNLVMSALKKQPQKPKIALNGVQKNIIESTFSFIFDDISHLTPSQAIKTLNAILSREMAENEIESLKKKDIWDSVKQIRDILAHPCPQNRYQGDANAYCQGVLKGRDPVTPEEVSASQTGVSQGSVYYYKSGFGSKILIEPQGILGLTSRNDTTAPSVTKEAVIDYVNELIQKEIKQYQNKAASTMQLWYRRTRDENKALKMIDNKENSCLAKSIKSRRG